MKYEKTLWKICQQSIVTAAQIEAFLKKHEGMPVSVTPKNIGKPGFEINTDEGLCFVTERSIDYYNKKWGRVTHLQEKMLDLSIPVPLYIGEGETVEKIYDINNSNDPRSEADIWLHQIFTVEIAIAYFHKYFSVSDSFNEYKAIIFEAIEAHYIGMDHIAIMTLIPVFEAGLRNVQNMVLGTNMNTVKAKEFEDGLKKLTIKWGRRNLGNYVWHPGKSYNPSVEIDFLTHICPQSDVINAFRLFFRNVLYKPSNEKTDGLNRHLIVHMLKNNFNNPANFVRIFLALTHITFIESLHNPKIPFFWPGVDEKDVEVGVYIRALSQFGDRRRELLSQLGISAVAA